MNDRPQGLYSWANPAIAIRSSKTIRMGGTPDAGRFGRCGA